MKLPGRPVMVKTDWRVCSKAFVCRTCGSALEAIGSTPSEAERRAVDLYAQHLKHFHARMDSTRPFAQHIDAGHN